MMQESSRVIEKECDCATAMYVYEPINTHTGLSHGERKRLSFATEMLPDPHIVIADEPTTGLDAFMARSVCRTLRNMADTGRIVICSIHQPSSQSFMTFTHVLLLANSRTAYYGRVENLVEYLNE